MIVQNPQIILPDDSGRLPMLIQHYAGLFASPPFDEIVKRYSLIGKISSMTRSVMSPLAWFSDELVKGG